MNLSTFPCLKNQLDPVALSHRIDSLLQQEESEIELRLTVEVFPQKETEIIF